MAQSPNIYLSLLLLKSSSKEKPFLTLRLVRTLLRVDQFRRPLDATLVRSIHLGFLGAAVATRAAAGPGFNQRASSLQIKPRKTKEFQGKMLGFPWISLADSGLFNGLRAKKIKFFARSHNSRLRLCAHWPQTPSRSRSFSRFGLAATPPRRGPFSGGQRQDSIGLGVRKGID